MAFVPVAHTAQIIVLTSLVVSLGGVSGVVPSATMQVLEELWYQTAGRHWTRCDGWVPPMDACQPPWGQAVYTPPSDAEFLAPWGDVCFVCDANGTMLKALSLGNTNLSGMLPSSLGDLTSVTYVNLGSNQLTGAIPDRLGHLTALRFLHLGGNQLTDGIPPGFGNLSALTQLFLFNNQLNGTIPTELGSLSNLTAIGLSGNGLTGVIPQALENLSALVQLILFGNRLTGEIPRTFGASLKFLDLYDNHLTGEIPPELLNVSTLTLLGLGNNRLTGVIPLDLGNKLPALTYLGVGNNYLSGSIPSSIGNLSALTQLYLYNNQLSGSIPPTLGNLARLTVLDLSGNRLTGGVPETLGAHSELATINLANNDLSEGLPASLFSAFRGKRSISLANNSILSPSDIFAQCTSFGDLDLDLSYNTAINGDGLKTMLDSALHCKACLSINLTGCNISSVPPSLVANVARLAYTTCDPRPGFNCTGSPRVHVDVALDLSRNPIVTIDSDVFSGSGSISELTLKMNDPTAGSIMFPSTLRCSLSWDADTGGAINISLANSGVDILATTVLQSMVGAPKVLDVDLSRNGYTTVPRGICNRTCVTSLDLTNNAITNIEPGAFTYTFDLQDLRLSGNLLTVFSVVVANNLPGLDVLMVDHNNLLAIPLSNNHISSSISIAGNPLHCSGFDATANNCNCSGGQISSVHCGYVRCTPTSSGCPHGSFPNTSDCSLAPWSQCVPGTAEGQIYVPAGQYYNRNTQSYAPLTNCSVEYTTEDGIPIGAYTFRSSTPTSDNHCSICSSCPKGYDIVRCTPTSNTQCTQQVQLSRGAIAGIVVAVLIPLVGLIVTLLYIRYRTELNATRAELGETQNYLELTEQLLGDERDELEQMEQAWSIIESDLTFGKKIGEGAFGHVSEGTWGHIKVAIKVLRHPVDDLDPVMQNDFDREVKFMRSCRHPHVLTFYGAGIDTDHRAFLVTELMSCSLKPMLRDRKRPLDWATRITFTVDIAKGMQYLHEKGTVHRDLKADNCFVDSEMRVKVADFGTGRIATNKDKQEERRPTSSQRANSTLSSSCVGLTATSDRPSVERTLSKGIGSLLWLAPEALQGTRLTVDYAAALDVYSYAIVLWEIWTRARPWEEVSGTGVHFSNALAELVNSGVRPQLPSGFTENAPPGYRDLMERCWSDSPTNRPTFGEILVALTDIERGTAESSINHAGVPPDKVHPLE